MPAGLVPPEPSVTLDMAPTDPGEAALAGGDESTRLAGDRRVSWIEDLARLCPRGTEIGSVVPLGTSEEMDRDGDSVGAWDSSGSEDRLVPGASARCLSDKRSVTAADKAPGGREVEGPSVNLRLALKAETRSESAGEGLGVETDAAEPGLSVKGRGGVWDDLIRSAANRTLVGTRLRRIAEPVVEAGSKAVPCCPPGISDHGEGRGFSGEINDAEVESEGVWLAKLRPIGSAGGAILRKSIDEGRRNSDARRGRVDLVY